MGSSPIYRTITVTVMDTNVSVTVSFLYVFLPKRCECILLLRKCALGMMNLHLNCMRMECILLVYHSLNSINRILMMKQGFLIHSYAVIYWKRYYWLPNQQKIENIQMVSKLYYIKPCANRTLSSYWKPGIVKEPAVPLQSRSVYASVPANWKMGL